MALGERISFLRKKRGISQLELANSINVSRQTLSKWENNIALPDIDNVIKLAQYFHVSTDSILLGEPREDIQKIVVETQNEKHWWEAVKNWVLNKENHIIVFAILYFIFLITVYIIINVNRPFSGYLINS